LYSRFIPELRHNAKLVDGRYEAANIVTQNLAQHFVSLRRAPLAAEAFAELPALAAPSPESTGQTMSFLLVPKVSGGGLESSV
jgi:hypothetical protein